MNKAWLLKAKSLQSTRAESQYSGRSSEQPQAPSPDLAHRSEGQTSKAGGKGRQERLSGEGARGFHGSCIPGGGDERSKGTAVTVHRCTR